MPDEPSPHYETYQALDTEVARINAEEKLLVKEHDQLIERVGKLAQDLSTMRDNRHALSITMKYLESI